MVGRSTKGEAGSMESKKNSWIRKQEAPRIREWVSAWEQRSTKEEGWEGNTRKECMTEWLSGWEQVEAPSSKNKKKREGSEDSTMESASEWVRATAPTATTAVVTSTLLLMLTPSRIHSHPSSLLLKQHMTDGYTVLYTNTHQNNVLSGTPNHSPPPSLSLSLRFPLSMRARLLWQRMFTPFCLHITSKIHKH